VQQADDRAGSFKPARAVQMSKEEQAIFRGFNLLTAKPVLFAANVGEEQLATDDDRLQALKGYVAREESYPGEDLRQDRVGTP